ncbi:MAG: hypothetical protein ABIW84_10075, partial [Ilumatobacteraceae bacterium]
EQRLGVLGKGTGVGPGTGAADATIDDDAEPEPPRVITEADTLTEYDLNEWQELERTLVTDSLAAANIPFRWEDAVLLVPTTDEERVEQIMDDVESGDVIPVINDGPDGDELPFESLNSFFLAGERLRKDPRDADGLERLLEALVIADPNRPPRGVELRTWRRTCDLAEELADALVAADADADSGDRDDDSDALDSTPDPDGLDTATRAATALHDLLRPLI